MKTKRLLFSLFVVLTVVMTGCNNGKTEVLSEQKIVETTDATQKETSADVFEEPVAQNEEQKDIVENTENAQNTDVPPAEQMQQESDTEPEPEPEVVPEPAPEPVPEPVRQYVSVTGITLTVYDVSLSVGNKTMPIVTMQPYNASDKGEIWQSSDETVATVDALGNIKGVREGTCTVTVTSTDNSDVFATVNVTVIPEPECTYIDGILIANKTYSLPQSYAPGWDAEASEQLKVMFNAAKQDGIYLFVKSGYRSYIDQKIIYNGYVRRDGQEAADRYSARPGHSEHQTGLAFDINSTANSFANTPEAAWIAENCYKYGFIIRYPKDKEHITGYIYEPWHVRYLGVEKAKEVYESGLCLEEFLGINSVYSY